VNFFGHATVAARLAGSPEAVLGAMLPDFAAMARVRPPSSTHTEIRAGIELHHRTDRLFHAAPLFVDTCRRGLDTLTGAGVTRSAARASCHVGVELLLDGILAEDTVALCSYRDALATARRPPTLSRLVWHRDADAGHFPDMLERLARAPVPGAYDDPDFVTERLYAILRPRRRLALEQDDLAAVRAWLLDCLPTLQSGAEAMLAEILEALH